MSGATQRPVALVTGGRRGIGRACCVALAERGFDVLAADVEEDGAQETAELVRALGGGFRFHHLDVARVESHRAFLEEAGRVDCLVNNAGVGALKRGDLLEVTPESWDRAFAVNARGSFFLTQAVAKRMLVEPAVSGPRCVIFISSANAALASPDRGEYCASKSAVSMLARLFALRLAEAGIAVHEIRPGVIRTDLTAPVSEAYTRRIADGLSPIRRWGEAGDIGRTVAMLAAGDLPFSTGDALHIDGGLHIGRL
ncbi:3-ketoacyl-ACP reductase [Teichococcus vastitatis]|jgi:NAD(P)-dependent dehydrogenase (short-subunit alcohol dehydrogenase family)|uniref:3-ketoacyl-ACP reductase n=1 Tax=Teichococcus vastitatis TaxID=2307076 RepID=A0ABS9W9C2_9PROT|nr:3-ketoacyl-ACP reductase [Pseudoroseomonas vastitatis]MCI0755573.1 3-ketoacyl-ACP reductase [Pseudoroseomonas vastitatis]